MRKLTKIIKKRRKVYKPTFGVTHINQKTGKVDIRLSMNATRFYIERVKMIKKCKKDKIGDFLLNPNNV